MSFKRQLEILFENTDEKYLELANLYQNGDKSVEEELRKMVKKVADSKGYGYGPVYHGSQNKNFYVFDINKTNPEARFGQGFYFTEKEENAKEWGPYVRKFYLSLKNPLNGYSVPENNPEYGESPENYALYVHNEGGDGIVGGELNEIVVYNNKQIKLADIITIDLKNIIPLSQRFDKTNPDIRY